MLGAKVIDDGYLEKADKILEVIRNLMLESVAD
jgi:hypothetical protein